MAFDFATQFYDINLKVEFFAFQGDHSILYNQSLDSSLEPIRCVFLNQTPGIYLITFYNSQSWVNSKTLIFRSETFQLKYYLDDYSK